MFSPCGALSYAAPEAHQVPEGGYDKKIDMWSIGCILYTILCGFPPFPDPIDAAVGYYSYPSSIRNHVPSAAKDLIANLLTVDPEKRYSIQEFLADPWIQTGECSWRR